MQLAARLITGAFSWSTGCLLDCAAGVFSDVAVLFMIVLRGTSGVAAWLCAVARQYQRAAQLRQLSAAWLKVIELAGATVHYQLPYHR